MGANTSAVVNIKKEKSARHIHFAVVEATGELVSIESVESGLACGCICAACGRQMEARKGEIRKHHFAHVSNYDCLYGLEISIYKAFFATLKQQRKLLLPDAVLRFHSYKKEEIIKPAYTQELTDVSYSCDGGQYPPLLLCYVGTLKLRIVLNFDHYYSNEDLEALRRTAKADDTALLLIQLQNVDALQTLVQLDDYCTGQPKSKEWIYNRVIEKYDEEYRKAAVQSAEFMGGVLCFAQKNQYKNVYSSTWEDCAECQYCYSQSENLCLAPSYINHADDFKKPTEERKRIFEEANHIQSLKKISEYKCPDCGAPLRRINGKNGVFAGCSNYPKCKKTFSVEPTTEQLIIDARRYYSSSS